MNWKQSFKFFKKHLWRKEAVAAILDLIQLSSESLWQLSKLLKVFLSHSESQEYFQTGFKNWILYYKSSIRYSFYERAGPNQELQAGVIACFSFLRGRYQTPDLQGRLQAKKSLIQTLAPSEGFTALLQERQTESGRTPPAQVFSTTA